MYTPTPAGRAPRAPAPVEQLNLQDAAWNSILDKAMEIKAEAGTVLLESGERSSQFVYLTEGSVRVYEVADDGRELYLYKVNAGDICLLSMLGMLDRRPCHYKVVAETGITALSLNNTLFNEAVDTSTSFRSSIFSAMAERVHGLMTLIDNLAFQSLGERLVKRLYEKSREQGGSVIRTTHQELASELGTSREVVSRLLKNMESKLGMIRLRRGAIEVVDSDCLQGCANDGLCMHEAV